MTGMPCRIHLCGSGLGQKGSTLYIGTGTSFESCDPDDAFAQAYAGPRQQIKTREGRPRWQIVAPHSCRSAFCSSSLSFHQVEGQWRGVYFPAEEMSILISG